MLRLSIILPCYNVERYIGACLDSIYRQDIPIDEYEVICVNDCSTDRTREIIIEYKKKHSNIILIDHTVNKTVGGARNTGIDVAKGNYIWFVDSDDMLTDNCLSNLLQRAEKNDLDIALFNFQVTREFVGNISEGDNTYSDSEICDGYTFLDKYQHKNLGKNSIVWLQLYRRTLIKDNVLRYPEVRVSEDAIFSWKALFSAKRVQSEAESRYIYRINPESTTANLNIAPKVWGLAILATLDLHYWITSTTIRSDYKPIIENSIRTDVNSLFKLYLPLNINNRKDIYRLVRSNKPIIKILRQYLGKRKRIVLFCSVFGFTVFNKMMESIKK